MGEALVRRPDRSSSMTELRERDGDQPLPVPNAGPAIHDLVAEDIAGRKQLGTQRYGTPLQPHNGRVALRDAYEEALDLTCYLKQVMVERDSLGDAGPEHAGCAAAVALMSRSLRDRVVERDEARAEVVRVGQVADAQVEHFAAERDLAMAWLARLVLGLGGGWDSDRVEECAGEALLRLSELKANARPRCSCDGDPIECSHEAARGVVEAERDEARAEVVRLGQEVERLTEEAVEAGRAELGADIEVQEAKDRTRELAVQLNRHRVLLGELWLSVGAEWRHLTGELPVHLRELWADAAEDWCGSVRYPEIPDRWWRTEEQPARDDAGTLAALMQRNTGHRAVLRVAPDTEEANRD